MFKPRPTRQRKSLANLLLVAPAFGIMGMLSVGAVWLVQQVQSLRCPSATFLHGSGQVAMIVQVVPIILASMGFGLFAVNWLAHLIVPLRRFFDRDAPYAFRCGPLQDTHTDVLNHFSAARPYCLIKGVAD